MERSRFHTEQNEQLFLQTTVFSLPTFNYQSHSFYSLPPFIPSSFIPMTQWPEIILSI